MKNKEEIVLELLSEEHWISLNLFNIKPNRYEISSYGHIRDNESDTSLKPLYSSSNGYDYLLLMTISGVYQMFHMDELMYLSFLYQYDGDKITHMPNIGTDDENIKWYNIIHLDGNNRNNSIDNLAIQCIEEIWVDISLYPGMLSCNYQISNFGRIRNSDGYLLSHAIDQQGYHTSRLAMGHHKYKHGLIHRLVATEFIPNADPINKFQVNHIDGNKANNSFKNLEWVSQNENIQHGRTTGLWDNKFEVADVILICKSLIKHNGSCKATLDDVSQYIDNVSWGDIASIKCGKCYASITSEYLKDAKFKDLSRKLSDDNVHAICKSLIKHEGRQTAVYEELKDSIPGLSKDDVRGIKRKRNFISISDQYFNTATFEKMNARMTPHQTEIVCECLLDANGDIYKARELLKDRGYNLPYTNVYNVKIKKAFPDISERYFDSNYFDTFGHKGLQEEDVIKICQKLIEFDGNIMKTFNELKSDIPNMTPRNVTHIKVKDNWGTISDKYFKYDHGNIISVI